MNEEELLNLRNEMISNYREEYRCASELLENLLDISREINLMMKTLHESLSSLEGLINEYFAGEHSFLIQEALTPKGMDRMLDSTSLIIEEINTMRDYTTSISDDMGKVIHVNGD